MMLSSLTARAVFVGRATAIATRSGCRQSLRLQALQCNGRYAGAAAQGLKQAPMMVSFSTSSRDETNSGLPPLQTVDELLAENEALRKEVASLKEQLANVKPGLMGTIKQYGLPFFFWWTGLYLATGVGFYGAFDLGLLDGAQVIDFVFSLGLDRFIDPAQLDPKHGNLALAIIVNEMVEPIRFPFALATIPYVKKALTREPAK